jgi:4-hydroxybenzoyl-CoA reductase subunit beta
MMTLPQFELHRPSTVAEALDTAGELISAGQEFDYVSGGTDLLMNYKNRVNCKPHLISLRGIESLTRLKEDAIGAAVTLQQLEVWNHTPQVMLDALHDLASPLVRETATLGGNLMVDTRCFFLNQSAFWRKSLGYCLKAEGDRCHVVPQKEICYATYSSDMGPGLMVMGAAIRLEGVNGAREVPLTEFYIDEGRDRFSYKAGEILTQVSLPKDAREWTAGYRKLRLRDTLDFPAMGVAVGVKQKKNGTISDLKIAICGVSMAPLYLQDVAHKYVGEKPTSELLDSLAEDTMNATEPKKNLVVPTRYRKKMVRVYTRRLLGDLMGKDTVATLPV